MVDAEGVKSPRQVRRAATMKPDTKTVVIAAQSLLICFLGFEFYQSRNDRDLKAVHSAASDIQGALSVGVTFGQFGEKLQKLAAEILMARDKGATPKKLEQYEEALQIYKDSYALWEDKIQHPFYYDQWGDQHSPVLSELAERYRVTIPTTPSQYDKAKAYNDVSQTLWKKAEELADAAK
jgi:hypothetical protein